MKYEAEMYTDTNYSQTDHFLVVIAAVADVLDIIVLGAAWNLTQQTLALCTVDATRIQHQYTSSNSDVIEAAEIGFCWIRILCFAM